MKHFWILICSIAILTSLFFLMFAVTLLSPWTPPEGNWYCEELQIQVSFSGGDSFYLLDGNEIPCDCINDKGSKAFFVITQASNIDSVPLGTEIFCAINMEFEGSQMIATQELTNTEYVFIKVE